MKILIADDHWVVRESLKQVVRRFDPNPQSFEAGTLQQALTILRRESDMDLVLADLVMPGAGEFDGIKQLRKEFPLVPIVVVSVHEDRERVLSAFACGAIGYVPKSASGEEIEQALERILAGEVYLPRRLIETSRETVDELEESATPPEASTQSGLTALTLREREVFDQVGRGHSVQKIATELGLSIHTVRVHLGNITKKLDLADRTALMHFAFKVAAGGPRSTAPTDN